MRLSKEKRLFSREQDERWTVQIYKVSDRTRRGGLNVYSVVDLNGEEITGKFYQSELEPIIVDVTGEFFVEKILKRRKRAGVKQVLVKWEGYGDKFSSWVDESTLTDETA